MLAPDSSPQHPSPGTAKNSLAQSYSLPSGPVHVQRSSTRSKSGLSGCTKTWPFCFMAIPVQSSPWTWLKILLQVQHSLTSHFFLCPVVILHPCSSCPRVIEPKSSNFLSTSFRTKATTTIKQHTSNKNLSISWYIFQGTLSITYQSWTLIFFLMLFLSSFG